LRSLSSAAFDDRIHTNSRYRPLANNAAGLPCLWQTPPADYSEIEDHSLAKQTESLSKLSACEPFLAPDEAASFMGGLNSRTVVRWAREGYLPAYPIGEGKRRLWRFRRSDLESWLLARRNRASPPDVTEIAGRLVASHRCFDSRMIQ
jgi:excisionase family DNA binding protein